MMESNESHNSLLGIEVYSFKSKDIQEIREISRGREYENAYLPTYCVRDNGFIDRSESYLQFTGFGEKNENEYILFNIVTSDRLLDTEISEVGFEEFINEEKINATNFISILKNKFSHKKGYDYIAHSIFSPEYVVIQLRYFKHHTPDGVDYDFEMELIGYLENSLNFKKLEDE